MENSNRPPNITGPSKGLFHNPEKNEKDMETKAKHRTD
jgi:hypothetical protein